MGSRSFTHVVTIFVIGGVFDGIGPLVLKLYMMRLCLVGGIAQLRQHGLRGNALCKMPFLPRAHLP
jgi:hypothetical protein